MKRNGLVTPYLIFVRGMVFPERHTTSGRADTSRKELKDYQTGSHQKTLLQKALTRSISTKIFWLVMDLQRNHVYNR